MKPTYEQLEAENKRYQDLLTEALQKIKELEEKLNKNSKNSSKAPSTDQKANTEEISPKKRASRAGKSRELYPEERVDNHVECTRSNCPH